MRRAAVLGWGVVAPQCADIREFARRLEQPGSWLSAFNGFGRDTFLVGRPRFNFEDYQPWIEARFPPSRFHQLRDKMDATTLYGIGAFIQALGQNSGLEAELCALGSQAHVYVATALGALSTIRSTSIAHYRAQRRWDRFWSQPERNAALRAYRAGDAPPPPVEDPSGVADPDRREELEDTWFSYWASRSDALAAYLRELAEIEGASLTGDIETGKLKLIRDKRRKLSQLSQRWGTPSPPWNEVSSGVLWNIANATAAQISMLGKITGFNFAPVAACCTFSTSLKLGLSAIDRGEAKLVVIGCADPPPNPLSVGGFYGARVVSADGEVSHPLTGLRGTHVSGGAAIWVLGDLEFARAKGFQPLGLEPLAVGASADAGHIITPSREGPRTAMASALRQARVDASQIGSWDMHATATPGDFQEVENLASLLPPEVLVSARKGTFGHGMGVGGGWELTAQYLGYQRRQLFPTPLREEDVHPSIRELKQAFVFDRAVPFPPQAVGKLSMGVGGVNTCVVSRPWAEDGDRPEEC